MILSDRSIREAVSSGRLKIEPFDETALGPSSLDLRLSPRLRVFHTHKVSHVDVKVSADISEVIEIDEENGFVVHPGEFILGSTVESFVLPSDLAAKLEGRSSLGRLGLIIHATAGFVDPGFFGELTFEISNVSELPIKIYPKMRIAQICFFEMSTPVEKPYGQKSSQKYQNQKGPTESRIYLEFKKTAS